MRSMLYWLLAGALPATAPAQGRPRAEAIKAIDSLVQAPISAGRIAGASVAVVKERDTLVLKGYGYADLDLDVPTPDRAVYEIGSVTKQFTAVAIMQLVEQGKLSLDDDLTKYLPDYPTSGNRIPIRRLLDHTSGIKGYTEIPEARDRFRMKLPKDSIVAIFSSKPFDFPTGEGLVYNNSAYYLAGLLIEKASGMSYGDYVERNVFPKAGMSSSSYCSETKVVKRRTHGYGATPNGLVHSYQTDHSWPYAAGSLCSTAGDLIAWLRAFHTTDKVISRASYQEIITPGTLNDGTKLRYAKGISVTTEEGRKVISHGGGISGFVSDTRYYPEHDLYIVVLINTGADAGGMARNIARFVLGPGQEPGQPFTSDASALVGTYRGAGRGFPLEIAVAVENGQLVYRQVGPGGGGQSRPLLHLDGDTFAGQGTSRFTFVREGGRATKVKAALVAVVSTLTRQP